MTRKPVDLGELRRLHPFDRFYGFGRGTPIDRYYIDQFLLTHAKKVCGRVLEVGDSRYTTRFGTEVTHVDVLDIDPENRNATIVDDVAQGTRIPRKAYDCTVVVQTFQLVRDIRAAIRTLHSSLVPGGFLLATMPGISQTVLESRGDWYWNLTRASASHLFGEVFGPEHIAVESVGNVLAATAFLYGLAVGELTKEELDYRDTDYQLLVTVCAQRGAENRGAE